MTSDVSTLQTIINHAHRLVFFGGAGVSTESGIPDFRSQDGLYHQKYDVPPETILSHSYFVRHTEAFYRFYRDKMICLSAKPNAAHKKLAEMEQKGILSAVVTQNIDGLHQMAGSKTVYELHGSVHRNYCERCHACYDAEWILQTEGVPTVHTAAEGSSRTWCCMRSPCRNRRWSRQFVPSLRQTCFSLAEHP